MTETFDEDYYLRGPETGKSNYVDYRWMPEQTRRYAFALASVLGIKAGDEVLDFGCARGFLVKALREVGVGAVGCDVSKWAIDNCDPAVKSCVENQFPHYRQYDPFRYVIAKDVLEHIDEDSLRETVYDLDKVCREAILIIVPLAQNAGGGYMRREDELDSTHQICWTFGEWQSFLVEHLPGCTVWASTHIEGIKRASGETPGSTGFYLIRK